ncbi:thioredoxin-dependent thiol peroxidase [Candidatus Berkiella aquae]|uniref:thioredoxin-dependent peroxiredoxin n=2 Tax=Candidatus Berkiella aquae TaxID=295108 RepID=A0A0Q9YVV3_9GAMM|nr:thioredoxin-dependent thiol peroxidase [Candidatus Berkiella aquae]
MSKMAVGDKIPDLTFESTDPKITSFKDLKGQNIVLYFYPKDNTPGCTLEGKDFRDLHDAFLKENTQVIGVSRDSLSSHEKFCGKHSLPFTLISDKDEKVCKAFGVIIEKNMFARLILGIERTTFLIDTQGVIKQIWPKVKVKGHAQAVLDAIKAAN